MTISEHNPQADFFLIEESAEEFYEMAPCGYLTTSIDGRIVKVNKTLAEWLGYTSEDLVGGMLFTDLLSVGGKLFYETQFKLMLRMQPSVDEVAFDIIRKDGRSLPTLINGRQKRNDRDEPILNRFTIFNATERRMYERQLLAAKDLFKTTLSSIADGVVATDVQGCVTFLNPVAHALCGWSLDAAVGKPVEQILILKSEATHEIEECPVRRILREEASDGMVKDALLFSREGRVVLVGCNASLIRRSNGEIAGAVLVFRDISERRKTEQQLRDANERLEKVAAELRRSNEELSHFAHIASHDLRSPLNTILQFTQLLDRKYGDRLGEGEELLGHLLGAAKRMSTLIEDLLGFARVSGGAIGTSAPIDANLQLAEALKNLKAAIDQSGASITHQPLPMVSVQELHLIQLFQNLIGNALRYRREEPPRIEIAVSDQGDLWQFSCKDNGIGVPPEYHHQIFEPFKRLHGSELPGSGIGLAVCRKIVERYGGRIWLESEPERGSTFLFTLPKIAAPI